MALVLIAIDIIMLHGAVVNNYLLDTGIVNTGIVINSAARE